jgi:hypothetical protein
MAIRFKGRVNLGILGLSSGTVTGAAGAATLNAASGKITTESLTTAAAGTFTETLTNSYIAATDQVYASVTTTGTGEPCVHKTTPAAGSCVFTIRNNSAGTAFNAALVISFFVIKQ